MIDCPYFFVNDTATNEIYTSSHTHSLLDALPSFCLRQEDGVLVIDAHVQSTPVRGPCGEAAHPIGCRTQVKTGSRTPGVERAVPNARSGRAGRPRPENVPRDLAILVDLPPQGIQRIEHALGANEFD